MPHRHRKSLCLLVDILLLIPFLSFGKSQPAYWQQAITYKMVIDMNVETNQFNGTQWMTYTNNSPDVLQKLYFHLYFNAFQPNSSMDLRSRTIPDPDPRIGERIFSLLPEEQGYQKINSIVQSGQQLHFVIKETILEVIPAQPIKPGQSIKLEMMYAAQVPIQIRRSGRDNAEGIRYSMSQWFPKMCEYDRSGWHTDPYIGREFYGVWGDFDVTINIDSAYTVAATGTLKNAKQIAHGYGGKPKRKLNTNTWNFVAKNVHDFVWTADPDYIHDTYRCKNGVVFHMFYQDNEQYTRNWKRLPAIMEEVLNYCNDKFGTYPYPQYSFIQGGDGGMEYPMATLITGNRPLVSLVGVSVHEFLHSWFYGLLGFNESYYYWMDEGFTNYAEVKVTEHLKSKGLLPGNVNPFPFEGDYKNYYTIVTRGIEEPLSTHADHFEFNSAYSIAAYTKGSIFLNQLEYIVGALPFASGMLDFFNTWKYKHPLPDDLILAMEKSSGLQLDWYRDYMVSTTKSIDYAIDSIIAINNTVVIRLSNYGRMPMPVDLRIRYSDGSVQNFTIPLDLMLGAKSAYDTDGQAFHVLNEWKWVASDYAIVFAMPLDKFSDVEIDPDHAMADMDRSNNFWPRKEVNE